MIGRVFLIFFGCLALSSCSYVKSYFPDKQKDYQLAEELPPLALPDDIKQTASIKDRPLVAPDYPKSKPEEAAAAVPKIENTSAKPLFTPVELVEYDGGATRLRIYQPVSKAWRYVGKALSHQGVEITARDESQYSYKVQYDPDAKKASDGALLDELFFLFGDDPSKEKEFQIKLTPRNSQLTEVIVLDDKEQPVYQGAGLKLLELLKKTINADLAQ